MRRSWALSLALVGAFLLGCPGNGSSGAGGCSQVAYSCPSTPPSYAKDVAPIIVARCGACHYPGGIAGDRELEDYKVLYGIRVTVLSEVVTCKMPQAPALPPTDAEKKTLLDWLACGAPDN